eukprot:symbB.v1.2.007745.t1/scaffold480.1/size253386/7
MLLGEEAYLLAEAEVYCNRLNSRRTAWSLERAAVAARISSTEERVKGLQRRNVELALKVRLLEEALSSCRRTSANSGPLFRGVGPVANAESESHARTFPCEEIEEWHALALRIPAKRKNWVDTKLYDALSRVGLANKETNGLSRGNHAHSDSTLHSEGSHEEEKESPWEVVATLHSHLDGVRSARICQGVLLTAGEDSSVKAWDFGALPMRCFIGEFCEKARAVET